MWFSLAMMLGGISVPNALGAGAASREVKVTLVNGETHTITLEGVGCSERLCSRITVAARAIGDPRIERIPLDTIAAVTGITPDCALFVFKDGTKRRLSVIPDNQVFYTSNAAHAAARIDLARVQSVEFVGSGR